MNKVTLQFTDYFFFKFLDADECRIEDIHGCDHHCVNVPGSFVCFCDTGFSLDSNNKTCIGTY